MQWRSDDHLARRMNRFVAWVALFSIAAAVSTLLGWVFHIPILKSWLPGQTSIKANTAIGLLLLGSSLWARRRSGDSPMVRHWRWFANAASGVATLLGALTLLEILFDWRLEIDQLLFAVGPGDEIGEASRSGLMAPIPAFDLLLLGLATLTLDGKLWSAKDSGSEIRRQGNWFSPWLAIAALVADLFAIFDFLSNAPGTHLEVALPTAALFFLLALGVVCASAQWAFGGLLVGGSAGARLLRKAIPSALFALTVLAWVSLKAIINLAHFTLAEVVALALISTLLLAWLIVWNVHQLEKVDHERIKVEGPPNDSLAQLVSLPGRSDNPVDGLVLRRMVSLGLALAIFLCGFIGFLSWRSAQAAGVDADSVTHTQTVLTHLELAFRHLVDVETGTRGFALTGQQVFLEPYETGIQSVAGDLAVLRALTADNGSQQRRLDLLEKQVNTQMAAAKDLVAWRQNTATVPASAAFETGKQQMDAARVMIQAMESEEKRLLEERVQHSRGAQSFSKTAIALSSLLGVILLLICRSIMNHQIGVSLKARAEVEALNVELEHRVEQRTAALEAEAAARRSMAETLRESEQNLRLLLDGVKDYAVYMLDPEGRVATWNEGAKRIKGYRAEEILGQPFAIFFTPEQRAIGLPALALKQAAALGRFDQPGERVRKDGSRFWAHSVILPLHGEDGKLRGFSKVLHDISEQKRAEDALHESEERLQTLADNIPQLVWIAEADGHIFWYNQRWYEYTGKTFDQMAGWGWQSVHDPAVLPAVMEKWKNSIAMGRPFEMVFPLRGADGSFRSFLTRVVPVRDQSGQVVRWFGTNTDITEQKQIEQDLRESEERFNTAFNASPIGTFIVRIADSTFVELNETLEAMTGYSRAELLGHRTDEYPLMKHEEAPKFAAMFQAAGKIMNLETTMETKSGAMKNLISCVDVISLRGERHFLGCVLDITERKRAESEIVRINAELEQRVRNRTFELEAANKELAAFSYSVSHDLRAPLRGIDGWSMALLEDYGAQLDIGAHEYLGRVRSETQRMGNLIDDMLRLSRVTRDEMTIEPVDLTALAYAIAAQLTEGQAGRRIEFGFAPGLLALGDQRLLEIALTNLLSNAVKFTGKRDKAHVEFGQMEKDGVMAFYVRDNGAGFDMAYLETLFGAFQRLHKYSEFPGTGVGLAIVQRVVGRHGGRVWAEAKANEGATFWFTLGVQPLLTDRDSP